jgi:hypothetical protein
MNGWQKIGTKEVEEIRENVCTKSFDQNGNPVSTTWSWDGISDHPFVHYHTEDYNFMFDGDIPKISSYPVNSERMGGQLGEHVEKTTYRALYRGSVYEYQRVT